jgi:hypothetical protein
VEQNQDADDRVAAGLTNKFWFRSAKDLRDDETSRYRHPMPEIIEIPADRLSSQAVQSSSAS